VAGRSIILNILNAHNNTWTLISFSHIGVCGLPLNEGRQRACAKSHLHRFGGIFANGTYFPNKLLISVGVYDRCEWEHLPPWRIARVQLLSANSPNSMYQISCVPTNGTQGALSLANGVPRYIYLHHQFHDYHNAGGSGLWIVDRIQAVRRRVAATCLI
jgi:hypothetical protein